MTSAHKFVVSGGGLYQPPGRTRVPSATCAIGVKPVDGDFLTESAVPIAFSALPQFDLLYPSRPKCAAGLDDW
jgi:hypothetical protein